MASVISLILLPFREPFLSSTIFSSHFPIIFHSIGFSRIFHQFSTAISTNCHLCTTSLQKDVNRSNDFRQMSVAIILTNGEKTKRTKQERKKALKNQHQRKLVSILGRDVSCMCSLSCGRAIRCFVFTLNRILPTLVRLLGPRFESWMSFVEREWLKRFAQRPASKKKSGRFLIWRRRQFISQLTNLTDSAAVSRAQPKKQEGAFNCHDCVCHVKLINYGIALIMLLLIFLLLSAWSSKWGVSERNRAAGGCCLWKSVIILIKCDLFSSEHTKEKFKRDQKGFGIIWTVGKEKVFVLYKNNINSFDRHWKILSHECRRLEIRVTSNAKQSKQFKALLVRICCSAHSRVGN